MCAPLLIMCFMFVRMSSNHTRNEFRVVMGRGCRVSLRLQPRRRAPIGCKLFCLPSEFHHLLDASCNRSRFSFSQPKHRQSVSLPFACLCDVFRFSGYNLKNVSFRRKLLCSPVRLQWQSLALRSPKPLGLQNTFPCLRL